MKIIKKLIPILLISGGLAIIGFIFGPVLKQEIRYQTTNFKTDGPKEITPVDTDFGLVVPKIGINARVFANISDQDPGEYLPVLKKGVAHARGSGFPGGEPFVFIFAHSANTPLTVNRYNAVFYLINKLDQGDLIKVFYQGVEYWYQVDKKVVVPPDSLVNYLVNVPDHALVLQTCYPPGTTINRLLVIAKETD
jgi:sortase A